MNVFSIEFDVNSEQSFYSDLEDDDDSRLDEFDFDGTPKARGWRAPDVYVLHPKLKRTNFSHFGDGFGTMVVDAKSLDVCRTIFEMSGEVLPAVHGDEKVYLVNVTTCINVLDHSKSVWDRYHDGSRGRLLEFAFHYNRFTETPLFKIPEVSSEILVLSGLQDTEHDFKACVERASLTGLSFNLLWSSGG